MFWHKIGGANENLVLDLSILVERTFWNLSRDPVPLSKEKNQARPGRRQSFF
jgi:hypothetical protein